MAEDKDRKPRPGGPGTTSDPNQSNRAPDRGRAADTPPARPVRREPDPEERRDDAADPGKR